MHVCRHLNREEGQEKKYSGREGVVGFGDSAGLCVGSRISTEIACAFDQGI